MLTIEADLLAVFRKAGDTWMGLRELRPAMIRPPEVVNIVTEALDRLVANGTLLVRPKWNGVREWQLNPAMQIVTDEPQDDDTRAENSSEAKALYIMILRVFKQHDDLGETLSISDIKELFKDHNPVLVAWAHSRMRAAGDITHCKGTSGKGARYRLSGGKAACPMIEVRHRKGDVVRVRETTDG